MAAIQLETDRNYKSTFQNQCMRAWKSTMQQPS